MSKIAIVFGLSQDGEYLSKRMLISFYKYVFKHNHDIHIFPYECNFIITDIKKFKESIEHQECKNKKGYSFVPFNISINWNDLPSDLKITPIKCSDDSFVNFFLPDVAVYNDFAIKYSHQFDFVLYCHNDITFTPTGVTLDDWMSVLKWNSEYSIISELRAIANYDISLRFHMCFVFVNVKKFQTSSLSFVNDYVLMDGNNFYVYGNGGTGLVASLYKKHINKPRWRAYLLDIHGCHRGKDIAFEDKWFSDYKWFVHDSAIEWTRSRPHPEPDRIERANKSYECAKNYVLSYQNSKST